MIVYTPPGQYNFTDDNDTLIVVQDAGSPDTHVIVEGGAIFQGIPGPSLYDLWKAEGNTGSLDDFLNQYANNNSGSRQVLEFEQIYAALTWTIIHNLNTYPVIRFVDTTGMVFETDYQYIDANTIKATFIAPTAGKAYIN